MPSEIRIEIEASPVLGYVIFRNESSIEIPGPATLRSEGTGRERRGLDEAVTTVFMWTLSVGGAAAVGEAVKWLFGRWRGQVKRIRINEKEVEFEEGKVTRVVLREIEIDQD